MTAEVLGAILAARGERRRGRCAVDEEAAEQAYRVRAIQLAIVVRICAGEADGLAAALEEPVEEDTASLRSISPSPLVSALMKVGAEIASQDSSAPMSSPAPAGTKIAIQVVLDDHGAAPPIEEGESRLRP